LQNPAISGEKPVEHVKHFPPILSQFKQTDAGKQFGGSY
jgi:hypothetical protein